MIHVCSECSYEIIYKQARTVLQLTSGQRKQFNGDTTKGGNSCMYGCSAICSVVQQNEVNKEFSRK